MFSSNRDVGFASLIALSMLVIGFCVGVAFEDAQRNWQMITAGVAEFKTNPKTGVTELIIKECGK